VKVDLFTPSQLDDRLFSYCSDALDQAVFVSFQRHGALGSQVKVVI